MKAQRATGRRLVRDRAAYAQSIIRMRLDGAHCNRCARENICMCRRRGGSCMTRRRTRSRNTICNGNEGGCGHGWDRLETFRQKTSSKREASRMSEDPAAQAKLAALGYAMSTTSEGRSNGRKPSQGHIEAIKGCAGQLLMKIRRYDGAIRLLQQLIAKDASIPILYYELVTAMLICANTTRR